MQLLKVGLRSHPRQNFHCQFVTQKDTSMGGKCSKQCWCQATVQRNWTCVPHFQKQLDASQHIFRLGTTSKPWNSSLLSWFHCVNGKIQCPHGGASQTSAHKMHQRGGLLSMGEWQHISGQYFVERKIKPIPNTFSQQCNTPRTKQRVLQTVIKIMNQRRRSACKRKRCGQASLLRYF